MKKLYAIILMFFVIMTSGNALGAEKVKIGYLNIVMSLPTFLAKEKGWFEKKNLDVELIPFQSGTSIIDALVTGRIDVNACSATTGFWFAEQNVSGRFKLFLTYGTPSIKNPSFKVVVKKGSPLKNLRDLKGKKVGTFPGATSIALAKAVIRTQIDPEAAGVIFTELPPPTLISALAAGQIDAFFAPEPFGMIAVSKGVGRTLVKEPLGLLKIENGFAGAAFGFSSQLLKERPQLAKELKTIFYKAVDAIEKDKDAYRPLLMKYLRLPEPVAMKVPIQYWMKVETLNKESTQEYFDLLYKEGAYKKKIDTTKLYYE